jgi:choline dehydrogenase-like flavoprotein
MAYNSGSKDDFDHIAKVTGDNGWSWDSMQEFIARNAKWSGSTVEPTPVSPYGLRAALTMLTISLRTVGMFRSLYLVSRTAF